MSIDKFFNKLDSTMDSIESKNEAMEIRKAELNAFFEYEIKAITPLLKSYEEKLKERGINCKLTIYSSGFSLVCYYKDGGHRGIEFSQDVHSKYNTFVFKCSFTNDDHKNYTSTDGASITEVNWSHENVKSRVEKSIEDFIFYADRHRGY